MKWSLDKFLLLNDSACIDFMLFASHVFEKKSLPETSSSPLKIGHPKRKVVFQPLFVDFFLGKKLMACAWNSL